MRKLAEKNGSTFRYAQFITITGAYGTSLSLIDFVL